MEITHPEEVTHALLEKSESRTLDEIREYGADQVRVIRPADVTIMISEGVDRLLRENQVMSDEDLELLVEKGPKEFRRVARERELDRQRAEQEFHSVQQELQAAHERIAELEQMLAGTGSSAGTSAPAPADAPNMEFMMKMMTEMADMKAQLAHAQGAPAGAAPAAGGADGIAEALGQISSNLNQRLEQMGKKMGISSAVEARDVDFGKMFDADDSVDESNMGDVEVKKKTGGGIAGNLAKLKKLKGGD